MTQPPPSVPSEIAAVDLGSNSFRLQMARVSDGQLFFHDSLREMVRLGAGLSPDKMLDVASQQRALDCLKRFGERLRGMEPCAVRVVATNTFRVAKNASQLIESAQQALGFPVEVIAGHEEARMIFLGVTHTLPISERRRLVMDIGGGSTEFIIGTGHTPQRVESLYIGCVSYSVKFFGDGKLSNRNLKQAEIAARAEIQGIRHQYAAEHWQEALGSSGTARTLGEILRIHGFSDGTITRQGLEALRPLILRCRELGKLRIDGLSAERAPSFPGGYAIMTAAFDELGITSMVPASGALREGVLYEMLGRMHHQDTREMTVAGFSRRYHVDLLQARRVERCALSLFDPLADRLGPERDAMRRMLGWACRLHEIGASIAHGAYHKHSAYIVENADMPGFARLEQHMLALLVRCQRRSWPRQGVLCHEAPLILLIMVLRLAVLFNRRRVDQTFPDLRLDFAAETLSLGIPAVWLAANPLTATDLQAEADYLEEIGMTLRLQRF